MKLKNSLKKYIIEKYMNLEFLKPNSYELNKIAIKAKLFDDLTSGNESKTASAAKMIRNLDNLNFSKDEIIEIKKITSKLPKSDVCLMYDYRLDIKDCIEIIENFANGNECKCNLLEHYERVSPESQIEMGFMKLQEEPYINKEKYQIEFTLSCTKCKTRWFTFEQHNYHHPWSKWTKN